MATKILLATLMIAATAMSVSSYDLVLKNGKIVKGTIVSEDQNKIVLKDNSGVQLTFNKTTVDQEKTAAANRAEEKPVPATPAAEEKKPAEPETQQPKKPARTYTESDIYRLRSNYPMKGTSSAVKKTDEKSTEEEKGEEYWKSTSAELLSSMQGARQAYNDLNDSCQKLKGATIQTHVVKNEKGETMNMAETVEEYCQHAEDAKNQYEQLKGEYESFTEGARMEGVPPGWIASEE